MLLTCGAAGREDPQMGSAECFFLIHIEEQVMISMKNGLIRIRIYL